MHPSRALPLAAVAAAMTPAQALGYDASMVPSKLTLACALAPVLSACALERAWADIEALSTTSTGDSETTNETDETTDTGTTTTEDSSSDVDPSSDSTSAGPTTTPTETTEPTTETTTDETDTETTEPDCGNGKVEGDEECDDGNQNNDDSCLNGCLKPYCGDGFFRPEDGEECDDGNQNDDDGCNSDCGRDRVVFVTSETYQGNLSSIVGATTACRAAAIIAGLENGDGFRPWLSDDASWPDMVFVHGKGRYTTVDGVVVADDWWDLTDGSLDAAITVDENGVLLGLEAVFTNTTATGVPVSVDDHCEGWTSVSAPNVTRFGWSTETDTAWTDGATAPCGSEARLYCFEQD